MTDATPQGDITYTHTVYRRDLVLNVGRLLALFWMGAALVAVVWYFDLPIGVGAVLGAAWAAQATRPLWDRGDNVIAVIRLTDDMLILQDSKSDAGTARVIYLRDIARVEHIGTVVAVRCDDDTRDGTMVGVRHAAAVATRIRHAVDAARG